MHPADSSPPALLCARIATAVAILLAGLVLLGWQFHIEILKTLVPGLTAMNPVSAVTFLLAGASIYSLISRGRRASIVTNGLALTVLAVGLLKLGEILGAWSIGFDTWLFHDQVVHQFWNGRPTLMAPVTSLGFVTLSVAILLRHMWMQQGILLSQLLLLIQSLVSLAALMAYLYGARSLNDFGGNLPMSFPSALTFLLLVFGTVCALPDCGVMRLLVNRGDAGRATQRLLMAGLGTPLLLGWITLHGQQAGFYSPMVSVAIFCVLATLCFATLTLLHGFMLLQTQNRRMADEEELRESEERFRLLSESAFEALAIAVNGVLVDVNSEFCRIFGYEYEAVIGKRSVDFVSLDSKSLVASHVANQSEDIYQAKGLRQDGSTFDIEIWGRMIPLRGQRARVTAVRDITERLRVQRMKDEFVSVVNHELRTPLTSIHGALGLMTNGITGPLPPAAQQMTDVALRNTKRLLLLINDLLDIQKIEAGEMSFVKTEIDLKHLIEANIQAIGAYAGDLNVTFQPDLGASLIKVNSDPDRLTQVLTNLFSNAAKFSPPGGVVGVNLTQSDGQVRVEVHDDGAGIPAEFQARVFEKFAQADSSATRQAGGTGLGLSICKSIMEKLDGEIGFTTGEGQGTTFYIELPIAMQILKTEPGRNEISVLGNQR